MKKLEHDPDRLMTVVELADYLNMSAKSVYNIIADITAADGKIMLRGGYRFVRKIVMARVEAGLFGRGLDQNGQPVGEPVSRAASARTGRPLGRRRRAAPRSLRPLSAVPTGPGRRCGRPGSSHFGRRSGHSDTGGF
jgi:hypothetical protein